MSMVSQQRSLNEGIENAAESMLTERPAQGTQFTAIYVDAVFSIWYNASKPNPRRLVNMTPDPIKYGLAMSRPSETALKKWIDTIFIDRAAVLDEEVAKQLADRLISEKVAMLDAHAVVAAEMQEMALTFLRKNRNKLNSNSAVRLLVEGVRIERESRGIPRTLEKLADRSDEELLAQIEDMLLRSTVDVQPIKDDD